MTHPAIISDRSGILAREKAITDRERGRAAGLASEPVEDCPPVGKPQAWREGWHEGKAMQRERGKAKGVGR